MFANKSNARRFVRSFEIYLLSERTTKIAFYCVRLCSLPLLKLDIYILNCSNRCWKGFSIKFVNKFELLNICNSLSGFGSLSFYFSMSIKSILRNIAFFLCLMFHGNVQIFKKYSHLPITHYYTLNSLHFVDSLIRILWSVSICMFSPMCWMI